MNIDVSYDELPSLLEGKTSKSAREPNVFSPEHFRGLAFYY